MRLAIVESAPHGGLLHYAAQLAEALAARDHDVDLITARGHELGRPPPGVRMRAVLPAAVSSPTEPPGGAAYLMRRAGIAMRVVAASLRTLSEVSRGRYDAVLLIDDFSVAPAAAGALILTALPRGPLLAAVCHEPLPRSRRPGGSLYESSPVLLRLLGLLYPRLGLVLVHGTRSRAEFEKAWGPARAVIIPHGDERLLTGDPPGPATEQRVLFFGELRRAKGLFVLMEAFDRLASSLPEARLTIAGLPTPDVDPPRVRAWAAERGERVELIDRYVELDEVRDLFARARVVATPYVAGSQSGVVHLAMTMGRAVVSSDVGDLAEAVQDGVTGVVVPAGDPAALRAALEDVLNDERRARRLGDAGRKRVLEEFGWERVAERVDDEISARLQIHPG